MKTKNYFVALAERELAKGEDIKTIADALANIAEQARIVGALSVWNTVNEAIMILGV